MSHGSIAIEQAEPKGGLSAPELTELLGAFNTVTAKLEESHEQLTGEVARLRRELREANEELQRSRRLAALGEMAAGIAHEIRNPLGAIALNARLLARDERLEPDAVQLASGIGRAVHRLDDVVRDVLAFARETRVRADWIDTAELLDDALAACAGVEGERRVRVERSVAPGTERVFADAALSHSAVVNVVRNAIEAMAECEAPEGGHRLRIETRVDEAADDDRGAGVAIVVTDTGPGIPAESAKRVFNPFFTTRETGTGLGLAIVHRIMDAHGGRVSISPVQGNQHQPESGRGTAVALVFPLREGRKDAEAYV